MVVLWVVFLIWFGLLVRFLRFCVVVGLKLGMCEVLGDVVVVFFIWLIIMLLNVLLLVFVLVVVCFVVDWVVVDCVVFVYRSLV